MRKFINLCTRILPIGFFAYIICVYTQVYVPYVKYKSLTQAEWSNASNNIELDEKFKEVLEKSGSDMQAIERIVLAKNTVQNQQTIHPTQYAFHRCQNILAFIMVRSDADLDIRAAEMAINSFSMIIEYIYTYIGINTFLLYWHYFI